MKSYSHITQIEKCSGLSKREFYNKYVKNSIPVVLTDRPNWSAFNKFTPEFFKSNYGHLTRTFNGKTYTLNEIIDLCQASTPENLSPYPNIFNMRVDFPELIPDVQPELEYGKRNRLFSKLLPHVFLKRIENQHQLFFGGKGNSFPNVHIDEFWVHTQLTQIIGDKEFILYAPDQSQYMYPDAASGRRSQVKNIHQPDLENFPLFKNAKALKVVVHPGESIFIPSGWWHTTYIHNFNLSFSLDHVNEFNWDIFMKINSDVVKINHPKLAWIADLYRVFGGLLFKIKETLFNGIK